MKLYESLKRSRSNDPIAFDQWINYFTHNGLNYPIGNGGAGSLGAKEEEIAANFAGVVQGAYKSNGVVFACVTARQLIFSEARFQYRRRVGGRPGELFGTAGLKPLETPWPGGTTGELLSRMLQDADLAGNFYAARRGRGRIKRMRPDWVTIVMGSESDPDLDGDDLDAEILGYIYHPGGPHSGKKAVPLLRESVAHFAPIPDPTAHFRGMSWLTPVIREIMGDSAATTHKLKFFENGATPNVVVSIDSDIERKAFEDWVDLFEKENAGLANAYRTMYLGAGAKAEVLGSDMRKVDFKRVQGAGETRIAAAAGIPPIIVGLSEGLESATYSNYGQARRRFADGTVRPLWREAAGSLSTIVKVPAGSELWYDDRDIPFLQEDRKDTAEIQQKESQAIKQLVEAGYEPASVIAAVTADDMSRLKHTGLYSVQLQKPGEGQSSPSNGNAGGGDPPPPDPAGDE